MKTTSLNNLEEISETKCHVQKRSSSPSQIVKRCMYGKLVEVDSAN